MTLGQWVGQWFGEWFGSGEPAPEGSLSGTATVGLTCTGPATAVGHLTGGAVITIASAGELSSATSGSLSGVATITLSTTGAITSANTRPSTSEYPFFSAGFWSAGFFSDGFWDPLDQPYNTLSYRHQVFVRTLLELTYVETTVDYVVAHAECFALSVRDSVEALKVLTKVADLRVLPAVKREAKKERPKSAAQRKKVAPRVFVQPRQNDVNVIVPQESALVVERQEAQQIVVNTGKSTRFVVESDKL